MSCGCKREFLLLMAFLGLCYCVSECLFLWPFSGEAGSAGFTWAKRAAWTRGEHPQTKSMWDSENNVAY